MSEWPLVRNGEDPSSVQGRECLPERVQANAVTAMHVCPYTEMLITGHKGMPPTSPSTNLLLPAGTEH